MIPKTIHYCWFGGAPLPELAQKCIASWKKYCPDYEIKEWNETNFDIHTCAYVEEAYSAKKWAFVSDYARFKILYENGGVYFDTDVELLKSIDEILERGPFMGLECDPPKTGVAPGLGLAANPGLGLAANPGLGLYKTILQDYALRHFIKPDGSFDQTTVVKIVTSILLQNGLQPHAGIQYVAGVYIYPTEYFCPMSYQTGITTITENTYSIHHFDGSWCTEDTKNKVALRHRLYKKYGIFATPIWLVARLILKIKHVGLNGTVKLAIKKLRE